MHQFNGKQITFKALLIMLGILSNLFAMDHNLDDQLFLAIQQGNAIEVKKLVKSGANVNARIEYDVLPLHRAIHADNDAVVQLLIDAGADPNAVNFWNFSPLHCAAHTGSPNIIKILLDAGAYKNEQNNDYQTPLHIAATNDHPQAVTLLLTAGADRSIQNKNNKTAFKVAKNDATKVAFLAYTTTKEVQHIIPFLIVLERNNILPKDVRKMLADYLVQDLVHEKIKTAQQQVPDYDTAQLQTKLKKGIISALTRKHIAQEQSNWFESFWLWSFFLEL